MARCSSIWLQNFCCAGSPLRCEESSHGRRRFAVFAIHLLDGSVRIDALESGKRTNTLRGADIFVPNAID
eukprot:SAG31_NODE_45349_length_259_cov_0.650000_1_plen_69_part_01